MLSWKCREASKHLWQMQYFVVCICSDALLFVLIKVLCLQIKGTKPIQVGTYATVIGGLIGVGTLAYLGLKL